MPKEKTISTVKFDTRTYLLLILLADGLIWLRSGWGKISAGNFADTLGSTLEKFASKNPYPWNRDLLLNLAIPNSQIIGYLVIWGEAFTALTLVLGSVYLILFPKVTPLFKTVLLMGVATGAFLNVLFYFSSGYLSSSTESLNLLMIVVEVVAFLFIWQLPKEGRNLLHWK